MAALAALGEVPFAGHVVRLSSRAFCMAEEVAGVNIPAEAVRCEIAGAMSSRLVHALIFAGIADRDESFTLESAHDLIDAQGYSAAALVARLALDYALAPRAEADAAAGE